MEVEFSTQISFLVKWKIGGPTSLSYIPLPFEHNLSMGTALEMITLLDVDALISRTNKGRLPLHMAIASGKGWKDLR